MNPLEGVSQAGGSRSVATLSTLTIQPQKEDDGAEYRCVAWNRAMDANDKKEATVSLTVNCKSSSTFYVYFLLLLLLLLLLFSFFFSHRFIFSFHYLLPSHLLRYITTHSVINEATKSAT